ncbi:MAG: GxxExxY protein [Planctomycetota bacterium]
MFKQEGYDMMGAAFEVYNELGLRELPCIAQAELNVFFKGHLLTPKYRPDRLVFRENVVELKALKDLCNDHEAQRFNYMRIARRQVGYLINFGRKGELEWKRFVLNDLH